MRERVFPILFALAFAVVAACGVLVVPVPEEQSHVPRLIPSTEAQAIVAQGAPPPYNDANRSVIVALGAMGRTEGFNVGVSKTVTYDVMSDALTAAVMMPTEVITELTDPAMTSNERRIVIVLTSIASSGGGNIEAVCIRAGPTTDGDGVTPALTCPNINVWANESGGCYLTQAGQTCSITLRPIIDPQPDTSYANRHIPIWVRGSSDLATASTTLHVGLSW